MSSTSTPECDGWNRLHHYPPTKMRVQKLWDSGEYPQTRTAAITSVEALVNGVFDTDGGVNLVAMQQKLAE